MSTKTLHSQQVSIHDWIGKTVWTDSQGYLCPELETPEKGQSVIYIDYELLPGDTLIQSEIELAIDAMGYPSGSRWIGRNSKEVDSVVSYVGTFTSNEVASHIEKLQSVVPIDVLVVLG